MLWANLRVSDKMKDLFDKEGSILKKDYMICVYMYVCLCIHTHIYNLNTYLQKKMVKELTQVTKHDCKSLLNL